MIVTSGGGSTEQLIDSEDEDDPDPFRTPSPITVDDLLSDRYPPYEARPCDMMAEPHRCDGYLNDRQSFNYYRGFDNPEVMNDRPVEETGCDYCPQHQAEARVHHHPRRPGMWFIPVLHYKYVLNLTWEYLNTVTSYTVN